MQRPAERKGLLRRLIARGYQPPPRRLPPVSYLLRQDGAPARRFAAEEAPELLGGRLQGGIAFVLPTYVGRGPLGLQQQSVEQILQRLGEVRAARPDLPLVLFIGMQHQPGQEAEARERIARLLGLAPAPGIWLVGFRVPGAGKVLTLNTAFRAAAPLGVAGIGWIDDDVLLEPGCLLHLVDRFRRDGCRGAVGATKRPVARRNRASRFFFQLKRVADTASNYPHGCCILVAAPVVAGGIPDRYESDERYVCFELLRPGEPDPLHLLRLVPEAGCVHHVGGTLPEMVRRINRMFIYHHVFLADYPAPVARYYFGEVLFYGLWPLAPWDRRSPPPRALLRWLSKLPYFTWFALVGLALAARGACGVPLRRAQWGSASYDLPEAGSA